MNFDFPPVEIKVGYATLYTMFPVFSLVLDQDISSYIAVTYPELYKELSKGRSLSYKTFFMWVLISIYQGECSGIATICFWHWQFATINDREIRLLGGVIMYGALILFEDEFIHIVAISFSALILTELIMVALTIRTWHRLMVLAEIFSLLLYLISLAVLHEYFGKSKAVCTASHRHIQFPWFVFQIGNSFGRGTSYGKCLWLR